MKLFLQLNKLIPYKINNHPIFISIEGVFNFSKIEIKFLVIFYLLEKFWCKNKFIPLVNFRVDLTWIQGCNNQYTLIWAFMRSPKLYLLLNSLFYIFCKYIFMRITPLVYLRLYWFKINQTYLSGINVGGSIIEEEFGFYPSTELSIRLSNFTWILCIYSKNMNQKPSNTI